MATFIPNFKKVIYRKENIKEIYVHTTEPRERDHFKATAYVPPTVNFIDIDTTNDSPEESLNKIINEI